MLRKSGKRQWIPIIAALMIGLMTACGNSQSNAGPDEEQAQQVLTNEQRQTVQYMNEVAERAYQSVRAGELEEARANIAQLSALSTKLSYDGLVSVEGMQAITGSITDAMSALNAVQPEAGPISLSVAKVRLTMDALKNREQPMWLGFHKSLKDDLQRMAQAVAARDEAEISRSLGEWKGHVSLIRPAVIVSRSASEAIKLDSISAFLENGIRSADWDVLAQAFPNLSAALEDLFRMKSEDRETVAPIIPTAEPPHPFFWSLILGMFIILVLTYVAWRRFQAEQGVSRVKTERDIHGGF